MCRHMNRAGIQAIAFKLSCQPASTNLGVGKDQRLRQFAIADQLRNRGAFGFVVSDPVDDLFDVLSSGIAARHFD